MGRSHREAPTVAVPPPIQMPARIAATIREARSSLGLDVSLLLCHVGLSPDTHLMAIRVARPWGETRAYGTRGAGPFAA